MSHSSESASGAPNGWSTDTFTLGALRVDRSRRMAWFFGQEVLLPSGALFDVLVTLCEAWSEAEERCLPVSLGALVRLANGKTHRLHYDDISRLRAHLSAPDLIECVNRTGYRVLAITNAGRQSGMRRTRGTPRSR